MHPDVPEEQAYFDHALDLRERLDANLESMQNLYDNMGQHGLDIRRIPFVIQYNKRDLPNAAPLPQLQEALNPGWAVEDPARQRPAPDPYRPGEALVQEVDGMWVERVSCFEACALRGDGVFDTLRAISKLVLKTIG